MPRIKKYDDGGDSILYDMVDESNGYLQPTFFRSEDERFEDFFNIKNLKCREDDIVLNSYPKTGTHWVWEIITSLTKKSTDVTGTSKIIHMIECIPTSKMEQVPPPRFLNSHLKIQYLPQESFQKKLKTVLVCRNPKDVAVSLFHHIRGIKAYEYDGKFENFLPLFMRGEVEYGSYPEYLLEWQRFIRDNPDFPILIVYYEDLKKDLLSELKRFREFLNLNITDGLLEEIGMSLVFNNMKVGKEKAMTEQDKELIKSFSKPGFSFLRKGQVGDWANSFTVAQNEAFDSWWTNETKELDMFKFKYS